MTREPKQWSAIAFTIAIVMLCVTNLRKNMNNDQFLTQNLIYGNEISNNTNTNTNTNNNNSNNHNKTIGKTDWWNMYVDTIAHSFRSHPASSSSSSSNPYNWCIQVSYDGSYNSSINNKHKSKKRYRNNNNNNNNSNDVDEGDVRNKIIPYYDTIPKKLSGGLLHKGYQTGLIFVKLPKAASSTGAGITMRIAHNLGTRIQKNSFTTTTSNRTGYYPVSSSLSSSSSSSSSSSLPPSSFVCEHRWGHGEYYKRDIIEPSLLWSMIRYPSDRAISEFFHFRVTRLGIEPTNKHIINFLKTQKNRQVHYLQSKKHTTPPPPLTAKFNSFIKQRNFNATTTQIYLPTRQRRTHQYYYNNIKNIMNTYHFIALVERMDESLVVMKLLFQLDDSDIIVLSSKRSGGYDDGRVIDKKTHRLTCQKINKSYKTSTVNTYISNNFVNNNFDYLLYDIVNKTLDIIIDTLGRSLVEQEVHKHRQLQKLAEEKCLLKTIFPCSTNGTWQGDKAESNCYWSDAGCGYRCVDDILPN